MTEAQAKASLEAARAKAVRFRRLRNLWRAKVRRRLHYLRYLRTHGPRFNGNRVEGGLLTEQLAFLFEHAPKLFRLYYSEAGNFAAGPWAVHNVPGDTWRSDCSAWGRNVVVCVRAIGPLASKILAAGGAFYTGWVVANCEQVSHEYAETHIGTAVIFGTGTGFHMGLSRGSGQELIQHGREPLEYGTFDQFGAGTEVRYYRFLT